MTSPTSADYAAPSNWQDFERLCFALYSQEYKKRFQRWGRNGQRQHGIDAYLIVDGEMVGLQCKGRSQGIGEPLTNKDIDGALEAVKTLSQPLRHLIILTTALDDVAIQLYAAKLSRQRHANGECEVSVVGWNSICDLIGQHKRIQEVYFGQWFRHPSIRRIALYGVIGACIATAGVVGSIVFLHSRSMTEQRNAVSVRDLGQFVVLTDDLSSVESNCEEFLENDSFAFQRDFRANCTVPAEKGVSAIRAQIEKVAPELDSEAWSEVHRLSELMLEDLRQAEMAALTAGSFEESVVRWQRQLCYKNQSDQDKEDSNHEVEREGTEAVVDQLRYYFVLRDFVIPGLSSMKARALVLARGIASQPVPKDLIDQANGLGRLVKERNAFNFAEPKQPFTLAAMKAMSARDIKVSIPPGLDPIERARWQELLFKARLKSLHGHPEDIEALISCGVLKPAARQLATSPAPQTASKVAPG